MKRYHLTFILVIFLISGLTAQVEIEKSKVVQEIDGKKYYIHLVETGETLYSISKVYNIPAEEIIFENPDIEDGLKAYQNLRIPMVSRDVAIEEQLDKGGLDYIFHIVSKGETLYGIARIYDITLDELKAANPGVKSDLKIGQYLSIPVYRDDTPPEEELPQGAVKHRVEPGETFYSLSREYDIDIDRIKAANPDVSYPKSGMTLIIPPKKEKPQKPGKKLYEHTVEPGETLYSIARFYGVPIDSVRKVNFGLVEDINAGQVLYIPLQSRTDDYIVHRVYRQEMKLKDLAEMYQVNRREVKNLNPRAGRRLYFNEEVKIPVDESAIIAIEELEQEAEVEVQPGEPEMPEIIKDPCLPCDYSGETFRVALMLPLFLEVVAAEEDFYRNLPEEDAFIPLRFYSFYQGVKYALDSLAAEGLKVELYVYDVDQNISKTIRVLQEPELQQADLIIGPFFRNSFTYVSNFAKIFGIRIVNPLSKREDILENNPYAYKFTPSEEEALFQAAEMTKRRFAGHKIILIRHNKYKNEDDISILQHELDTLKSREFSINNSLLHSKILDEIVPEPEPRKESDEPEEEEDEEEVWQMPEKVLVEGKTVELAMLEEYPGAYTNFTNDLPMLIYAEDSLRGIEQNASILRPNLVIGISDDEVFAIELMTAVNELKDSLDITVLGLPDWHDFGNIETRYLIDFNTHFLSPVAIDYEDEKIISFVRGYRQKYMDEPGRYAFVGFDIAWYFLSAMKCFGIRADECLQNYHPELLRSKYIFRKSPGRGYENVFWNIARYRGYEIIEIENDYDFSEPDGEAL